MDTRVAAYGLIVDRDARILLAHWNQGRHSAWTLPGGGLEPGEDPRRAARREIREETGYRAEIGEILGVDSRVIPSGRRIAAADDDLHTLRIVYRAAVTGGRLRDEVDGSTDRAAWFPLSELGTVKRVRLVDVALTWAGLRQ